MSAEGKTVLVTGGTRGIGSAIAGEFFRAGANVVATFVRDESAAETLRDALDDRSRVLVERADAADPAAMREVFDRAAERFGSVDILVNNAGVRRDNLFLLMPEADWYEVIRTNLHSVFVCTRLALKPMISKRWGRIVNLVSPSGVLGREGQANYAASKGAVVSLTKTLAKEVARMGITVNAVSPGVVDTDMTRSLSPEAAAEFKRVIPMRRLGTVHEIAAAVLFLASDAASYLTGQVIGIDGGLT
ncbi:MAG: 3-oxoacyl-ACP reductase family protein [Syntrophobacteraceae bacterium]